MAATDERFIISLKDRTYGFALVRTHAIIEHLFTTYGKITADDLTDNDAKMRSNWDVTSPIEGLFEQIDDGAAFAIAGRDPYTDTQLVRFGYTIIEHTNRMEHSCRTWRHRPPAEKTWANFKLHFKAAHLDLRLSATIANAGFANHTIDDDAAAAAAAATDAHLANLAEATITTNEQMASLAHTVAQLQVQLQAATRSFAGANRPARRQAAPPAADPALDPMRYCWTHGGRVAADHTSLTCRNPAEGHQTTATRAHRMGGSDRGCD